MRFSQIVFGMAYMMCMDEAGDNGKGNGGGNAGGKDTAGNSDSAKVIADLTARLDAFEKKYSTAPPSTEKNDDLNAKAKKTEEERQMASQLEAAVTFNAGSKEFLKTNEALFSKEIADIFSAAEKEKYESVVEKANSIKAAVLKSFFALQSNVDLLTPAHKVAIADYLKLTVEARKERAHEVFTNVFEPAVEILRKAKKVEEVSKAQGVGGASDKSDSAYLEKLTKISKQHYMGEKNA